MREVNIDYQAIDFQRDFHNSEAYEVALFGGYGCGKTYSLVMKAIQLAYANRGMPGGIFCPDLKMFRRDVLPTVNEIFGESGLRSKFNQFDSVLRWPDLNTEVYVFHDQDKGRSIRGPNLAWGVANEVTLCSQQGYDAFFGRVRLKKANHRQIAMSGTPEGFNWVYDRFIAEQKKNAQIFHGDTNKNPHIAPEYVQMLYDSYDPILVDQYVRGLFVNLSGNAAVYAFDRRKFVSDKAQHWDGAQLWVTMDFNVNPMSGVIWCSGYFDSPYHSYAIDEIKIMGSNTYEFADALVAKGIPYSTPIYPDPAGKAKSTKSKNKSDFDILRQKGFTNLNVKKKISVRDCLNALNNLFAKNSILINPKCKEFIKDLEQCIIKPGTHEIDKSDPLRTHWLDGAKYWADYEYPVTRSIAGARERRWR